jgi:ribosomal protein S18 acetylase RimI-like enzyme
MEYRIQELEEKEWKDYEIMFCDFADNYYEIDISYKNNDTSIFVCKKPLETRKDIKYPNRLFGHWLKDVKAWGIIIDKMLIAVIETAVEQNNRLYISELWVDEKYRRQGIATSLMKMAKERAVEENFRIIYLETRSCNEHAIEFYISQGFRLIGLDICAYSNEDIENNNVPLKFGYFL